MLWNYQLDEEGIKKIIYDQIKDYPKDRFKEALVTIEALLENGYTWDWIFLAITDEHTDFAKYGFSLVFNQSFKARIDRKLLMDSTLPETDQETINRFRTKLFSDVLDETESAFS